LASDLQVSRSTLRAALHHLEQSGVIAGKPQSGWYLTEDRTFMDRGAELKSFTEIAQSRGFTPSSQVLSFQQRRATMTDSERLRIPPGSAVLELQRLRLLDDVPTCIDTAVIPAQLCEGLSDISFQNASLYEQLNTHCGISIARTECTLRAHGADPDRARLLQLEPGEALLEVDSTGYDTDGHPVLISIVDFRGDSYRFTVDLVRHSPFPPATRVKQAT
jgi:GntR family transcriptional regulator